MGTKIEWADESWNPLAGCRKVSSGCLRCYAETMAARLRRMKREPYLEVTDDEGAWTGKTGVADDATWRKPLRWKKPRRVFVCSMCDLFFEWFNAWTIARVFAVFALARRHTFLVLTKRPRRMRVLLTNHKTLREIEDCSIVASSFRDNVEKNANELAESWGVERVAVPWPLPNVAVGTTVEKQELADERIPELLGTPAAARFISCEPLLGPVDLAVGARARRSPPTQLEGIDQVIVGGETSAGARPMHPGWARELRAQATANGVPFFFKQWGAWSPRYLGAIELPSGGTHWPRGLVVWDRRTPKTDAGAFAKMWAVGKKAAGRVLDGRTWEQDLLLPRDRQAAGAAGKE